MADEIWNRLTTHLAERENYFRLFDRHRMRPDAWLKVEVIAALSQDRSGVREVRPDRQGCDVWLKTGGQEIWLGIRGLITSYAGSGPHARPTIASVEEISREMDKLTGLATLGGGVPALLLVAFPFGPEPRERNEWSAQMLRFEAKGFEPAEQRTLTTNAGRECRIYLFVRGRSRFD
jgi:hypothetical protein